MGASTGPVSKAKLARGLLALTLVLMPYPPRHRAVAPAFGFKLKGSSWESTPIEFETLTDMHASVTLIHISSNQGPTHSYLPS
jgi:hypothetical protein